MNKTNQRVLIAAAVLLVVACICTGILVLGGIGAAFFATNRTVSTATAIPPLLLEPSLTPTLPDTFTPTSPTFTPSGPTLTPTPCPESGCPTPTPTMTPAATLPPEILNQLLKIQTQVEALRGLKSKTQVPLILLSPDQLRQHVTEDLKTNYIPADAQKDQFVLSTLGLIPADLDMLTLQTNLQAEQIAGFYDDKTQQMYVITGSSFGGNEKLTYSHEFTHVLQDQNYGLRTGLNYNDDYCKTHSEYCAAVQALVEGDAVESEMQWLTQYATAKDKSDIVQATNNSQSPVYDSAPDILKDELIFPYRIGNAFVIALFDKGGWAAVDNAYHNPPVSTEQIMHPELYPIDKPVEITLPDLLSVLGQGWTKVDQDVMGEFDTYELLAKGITQAARLPDNTANQAAAGWGGDAYAIFKNAQNQPALVLNDQWDTDKDATEFADAFLTYAFNRWGKAQQVSNAITAWQQGNTYVFFLHSGLKTLWIQAPDQATAQKLLDALK